jgi:hypothetical protein
MKPRSTSKATSREGASDSHPVDTEFDFALVVEGVAALTEAVTDAIFEAGCDDSTPSIQYGLLYLEFSRQAPSLRQAITSAIRDVEKAGIGARVLRVDDCNLVTAADIARRIGRSRQLVHQYMNGDRGPGGFPAPVCHLAEHSPLWTWCQVSYWLVQNQLLRPEVFQNAEVVDAINTALDARTRKNAALVAAVQREMQL